MNEFCFTDSPFLSLLQFWQCIRCEEEFDDSWGKSCTVEFLAYDNTTVLDYGTCKILLTFSICTISSLEWIQNHHKPLVWLLTCYLEHIYFGVFLSCNVKSMGHKLSSVFFNMFCNWDFLGLLVCYSRHLIEMLYGERNTITISLCFGSKMR